MSDDPRSIPLPDDLPVPLSVVQRMIGAGERAIDTLNQAGYSDRAQDLDDAIAELSAAILRHIGLWDDEE